jgi:hypothetical protein
MYKVLTLTSAIALALMLLTSCGTAQKAPTPPPPPEEAPEKVSEEDLDRGFDPCLINPKLPSCKKKNG